MIKYNGEVKLLYATPLVLISNAIHYSHANWDKSDSNGDIIGEGDFNLIKRVGFKYKHESVLEHSLLSFHITCSRAMLQELARHRLQSMTVKSTRYTLKELLRIDYNEIWKDEVLEQFLIFVPSTALHNANMQQLRFMYHAYHKGYVRINDVLKYALPEAYKTSLQLTLNLRSLLNLLRLRLSKDALWEFRLIAKMMLYSLPDDYKELVLTDETIRKNYEQIEEQLNDIDNEKQEASCN
jgi:thymidylate synthase (FAD)